MNVNYATQSVEVIIENGHLHKLSEHLDANKKYCLITDKLVYALYKDKLNTLTPFVFRFKQGEKSKKMRIVNRIIHYLMKNEFTKSDAIIAFGGGVVGDVAGFVAAMYKRGISYIQVPTTLIAQVDSAIGGKVGINVKGFKNQIGCIYHPEKIIVDPELLKTLDIKDYLSGLGEVVKYAVLFDVPLMQQLESKIYHMDDVIKRCIALKVKITVEDEYELHKRKLLNFGHTLGHAIEAKYKLPHGISIACGMSLESKNPRVEALLRDLGICVSIDFKGLYPYILQDKKRKNQTITKVVLRDIGDAILEEGDISEYFQT